MKNGQIWQDDCGENIQAHGGMITRFHDTWYWYGENKGMDNNPDTTRVDVIGVSCYSSTDLKNWHHEGIVLPAVPDDPSHPLHPSMVLERPKVLFHPKAQKYVMWFHSDTADYTRAQAGCAIADQPEGPFRFLGVMNPNRLDCRDMTLFIDRDQNAWLVHSGNWNKTLYFSRLSEDYLDFTGEYYAALIDQEREAPALIWHDGLYYCVTSGCTGWRPNAALYSVSRHISTGWKLVDNPCVGPSAKKSFLGQPTWIFEQKGKLYILMDHWKPYDLQKSGYSILPISFDEDGMNIRWQEDSPE